MKLMIAIILFNVIGGTISVVIPEKYQYIFGFCVGSALFITLSILA